MSLPNEILFQIFVNDKVAVSDLGHLMLTCQRFWHVIRDSNELWRQKFLSRYFSVFNIVSYLCLLAEQLYISLF